MRRIIVGTRGSQLALAQTRWVLSLLESKLDIVFDVKPIKTTGDKETDLHLSEASQVGLFTRGIETELINKSVDMAVHSLKDLPLIQPAELCISAIPERKDPSDVLVVSRQKYFPTGDVLPLKSRAVVGTGSPRRHSQLLAVRPDLRIRQIRGNITTRQDKIAGGEYDAVVFAKAGLERLNHSDDRFIIHPLSVEQFVPAPGQGALAVEMRCDDPDFTNIRQILNDPVSEQCVKAERTLLKMFGGGCSQPVGALVTCNDAGSDYKYSCFGFWAGDEEPRWSFTETDDIDTGLQKLFKQLKN